MVNVGDYSLYLTLFHYYFYSQLLLILLNMVAIIVFDVKKI